MYVLWKNNVVIKEKVHENDRKAAKTLLTIFSAKWNESIYRIRPLQIEHQRIVNNIWFCNSGDYNVIWSLSFMIRVLAAYMGRITIDDISTI